MGPSQWGSKWQLSPVTIVLVSVALGLAGNLATGTLHVTWQWWPVCTWIAVGLLVLISVLIERARSKEAAATAVPGQVVNDAAAMLASIVQRQWADEAAKLELTRPFPLQVNWSSTRRPVAAGRDAVLNVVNGPDWRDRPLSGKVGEIASGFRRLPSRQLVVLGDPGAGKTALAVLLMLALLKDPLPNDPVPVLFPIASWDPHVEPPDVFALRRLSEDYKFLSAHVQSTRSLADLLMAGGKLFLILDGLDELPDENQSLAVESLDQFAATGQPLMITCRSREYERAVMRSGRVLSKSAVIEIEPVGVESVIDFLSQPPTARQRWLPVFDHLRQDSRGALAKALSTPLMVNLARTAYRPPATDPSELLDLPNVPSVARKLIDGFIASVYNTELPDRVPPRGRRRRAYGAGRARNWLSCIAYDLLLSQTVDFWWWQLRPGLLARSAKPRSSMIGCLSACVAIFAVTVSSILMRTWLIAGIACTILALVISGSKRAFRIIWPAGYPPYQPRRKRSREVARRIRMRRCAMFGVVFGEMTGIVIGAPILGFLGGLLFAATMIISPSLAPPVPKRLVNPQITMRANRRNFVAAALQAGIVAGVVFTVVAFYLPPIRDGVSVLDAGFAAAMIFAFAAASNAGLWTWVRFRATHLRLALYGWLPLRLVKFMDDACKKGVLRQAGTAWQFRHAFLLSHLAQQTYISRVREHDDADLQAAGVELVDMRALQGSISDLQELAQVGNRYAAQRLTNLLAGQGAIGELRVLANGGDDRAARWLADLLAGCGQIDEAVEILRQLDDSKTAVVEFQLVRLLARQGAIGELRARVAGGSADASYQLAGLLAGRGRIDEALGTLRALAASGDGHAADLIPNLLVAEGRGDEAVEFLQAQLTGGDHGAERLLECLQDGRDRGDEAVAMLHALADDNDDAALQLLDVLTQIGRADEAAAFLQKRVSNGDSSASRRLAKLHADGGRIDEAIAILRASVAKGDFSGARQVAEYGHADQAIEMLRVRREAGDHDADGDLADILAEHGRVEEAVAMLRARARDDGRAMRKLASILAGHGRADEAIEILRAHSGIAFEHPPSYLLFLIDWDVARDEADARSDLARLLAKEGREDELRMRADVGDLDAEFQLSTLLDAQGRIDELRERAAQHVGSAVYRLAERAAERGDFEDARATMRVRAYAGNEDGAIFLLGIRARSDASKLGPTT